MNVTVPTFDAYMNPVLEALRNLGGSGTIEEIRDQVASIMELTDDQLEVIHDPDHGTTTKVEYRLAWARTYLKNYGLLENSSRGIWALTSTGRVTERVDERAVRRYVKEMHRGRETKAVAEDDNSEAIAS